MKSTKPLPTLSRVCDLLRYDPATGIFTWKVARGQRVLAGDTAGSVSAKGYLRIKVDGVQIRAHRLAWFMHTGSWPENEIDHRDGDRLGNWFDNLRDVTTKTNAWNRQMAKHGSKSRLLGVIVTRNGKSGSAITRDGKVTWLGTFDTAAAANTAYWAARAATNNWAVA